MDKVWDIFPRLCETVYRSHAHHKMAGGHNFDHSLQVAQCAYLIAETEEVRRLAAAAGLCHSADRILQKILGVGKKDVPEEKVVSLVHGYLDFSGEVDPVLYPRIVRPVLAHSGPNLNDGDDVLVALQDADRVTCAMADAVMGAAQYWSEIPIIDPQFIVHPDDKDFRHPRCVARDLLGRNDWIDPKSHVCVRLPKAKELMKRRVAFVDEYLREVGRQRAEVGLYPNCPFPAY